MHQGYRFTKVIVVVALAIAVGPMPGCKRAPEEVEPMVETPVSTGAPMEPTARVRLETLDPPQVNPQIGITLDSLPDGLVITGNEDRWLEIYDSTRITVQYTFVALPPDADGVSLSDLRTFESFLPSYDSGEADTDGTYKTTLGNARWASGTYLEDDEPRSDVRVFAPHPTGRGTLVVYSTCPRGVASVQERLNVIQDLLRRVS